MQKRIHEVIHTANNLSEVELRFVDFLDAIKSETMTARIGYVAGIVSSDGEDKIQANIEILASYTEKLRQTYDFPVFCAADVFTPQLFESLAEMKLRVEERERHFKSFWRNVIASGHITDIFMTPRWELSSGANDEYSIAKQIGLRVHNV